jgi:hypothetical protein
MSEPQKPLLKTCSVCGLQKPLSAFLQLSDKGGLTYGHICGHCRLAGKGPTDEISSDDGMHTEELELKLDAKEKIQSDLERELRHEEKEALEQEEREAKDKETYLHKKHELKKAQQERKHRESFLQRRAANSAPDGKAAGKQGDLAKINKAAAANQKFAIAEEKKSKVDYQFQTGDNMRQGSLEKYKWGEFNRRFKAMIGNPLGLQGNPQKVTQKNPQQTFDQMKNWLGATAAPNKTAAFVKNVEKLKLPGSKPTDTPTPTTHITRPTRGK